MVKFDKNYNSKSEKTDLYKDWFDEMADQILEAKEAHRITEHEASFLLRLALRKQVGRELKAFMATSFERKRSEKLSMFMRLQSRYTNYA